MEVRKSSWLRKIWRLQWISPFKRRACLSSSSRSSLTVAYRRLKSDTIDFLLSKWHDSPASSLCLAEIARRAAMSMLFCMFFGLQHNSKRKSGANVTRNRKNSGSVYWVLKKLLWFLCLVYFLAISPTQKALTVAISASRSCFCISAKLLLVATQPIGEACSKSLTNWSPSDRKWFQNSLFHIQCQFPSSRSSKSSKLLRSARSAPSSCLSSWRRACKACSSLTHSTTKLDTWWSRGSENLSQNITNWYEINKQMGSKNLTMYKSSFMWRERHRLLDTKRTVSLSKRSHGKTVTDLDAPEPPRAHYPSPGTAAGSNLPTPDSKTIRKDREVLKDVGKVYKSNTVLIFRNDTTYSTTSALTSLTEQLRDVHQLHVAQTRPASSNTRRISVARPVAETHLANCNEACAALIRHPDTIPPSWAWLLWLNFTLPLRLPNSSSNFVANPSPTTAGGPPMGGRIWECRSHFQPEAMTCNSSASCQVQGEESQPPQGSKQDRMTRCDKDIQRCEKGDKAS